METIFSLLSNQPLSRVIRLLLFSRSPRHLRELAELSGLSPSGVSDILRRLSEQNLLSEQRVGKKRLLSLQLSSEETENLKLFFSLAMTSKIKHRAKKISKYAPERIQWMEETTQFFKGVKRHKQ